MDKGRGRVSDLLCLKNGANEFYFFIAICLRPLTGGLGVIAKAAVSPVAFRSEFTLT